MSEESLYVIELKQSDYLDLLRIVMKYGTGTGEGGSSNSSLRTALGNATTKGFYAKGIHRNA